MKSIRSRSYATILLLASVCAAGFAQTTKPAPAPETRPAAATAQPSDVTTKSAPAPADARQAQLQADTEKLLKLTQELKAEVAKSNKDTLSLAVVKKAEEVEKLAKSLKERMRTKE